MKTYGKSRSTAAPPERIWQLWSDPNNWTRWNSGIKACRIDGPLVSGATGEMETAHGSTHAVTFDNVQAPRGFTMSMDGMPLTRFTFVCRIEPAGTGSTISQGVAFSGPLAFIAAPLLGPQMASHFMPVLDDLAAAAEAP